MRFGFVADVSWWALYRNGDGLRKYHGTKHSWDVVSLADLKNPWVGWDYYDLVVFGSVAAFFQSRTLPERAVITLASFRDAQMKVLADGAERSVLKRLSDLDVAALVINDRRMFPLAVEHGFPVVYHPDRIDPSVFYATRNTSMSPKVRVGWAGSDKSWPGVKNLDRIQKAAKLADVELVLQRREVEGLKSANEMREWYGSLDVYVAANVERTPTPVPVLEALACGRPVITSKCGEVWPLIESIDPGLVMRQPSVDELVRAMSYARRLGPERLRQLGERLGRIAVQQLTWLDGSAGLFTQTMEALCHRRP